MYVLSTNNLTKKYGKQEAISNVSINVKKGSIYGLIGKNGAGKTTLMRVISGLAAPDNGEINLFNKELNENDYNLGRIGVLLETPGIYGNMTAFENLKLKALAIGIYNTEIINDTLKLVGLHNTNRKKAKNFSLGMKQRLGIALALIGNPDLLILDEPINGLDPQGIIEIRELIQKLNKERNITIMVSSHILEELSKLVTDYGIIENGKLLLEISTDELNQKCTKKIELVTDDINKAIFVLEENNIKDYKVISNTTIYIYENIDDIATINKTLVLNNVVVNKLCVNSESIEEFFLELTQGGNK